MNPPLGSRPMSQWSTEAAAWIYFLTVIRKGGEVQTQSRSHNQTGSCRSHVPPMKQLFQKILCKHQSDVAFVWVKFPIKQEIKTCFFEFLQPRFDFCETITCESKDKWKLWESENLYSSIYSGLKLDWFHFCAYFHTHRENLQSVFGRKKLSDSSTGSSLKQYIEDYFTLNKEADIKLCTYFHTFKSKGVESV